MGKDKTRPVPPTGPRPTGIPTEVTPLPPQGEDLKAAQALLGLPVRACVGGHMATVFLTDYDIESVSYHGLLVRNRSMNTDNVVPHLEAVHGLRAYPYSARPDYAFQFVKPGDDESVLINIAQKNAVQE
jgi:hypothetical protein